MIGTLCLIQNLAFTVLPNAEQQEGKSGGGGPELGVARNLGFRLPAEKLRGDKEGQNRPEGEGKNLDRQLPDGKRGVKSVLETGDEIGGRQEDGDALDGLRQIAHRQGRAGQKNEREPNKLVEDLGLLHGVGHTGNHQTKRAERYRAHSDEDSERKKIAKIGNMEDQAGEGQLHENGGESERVVRQETRGEHIRGGDRSDVEAPQNALFAKHDQGSAETPEAAHHVQGDDRPKKIANLLRITLGENSRVNEKHAQRKNNAEKKEHFVAQRQLDTHARQIGEVIQSRSLLPVISMKTSSREGEAISRLTSSLPWASRCLTIETIVCGGRLEWIT